MPPKYPDDGYPKGYPTGLDEGIYGTTPSEYLAAPMGLLYVPISETHGRICTASAVNKRWVFTTAHCVRNIDKRVAVVYMPNHDERKYEKYGTKLVLSHKSYTSNSTDDLAVIYLRRFYKHLPNAHARIHGAVKYALRPGSVWASIGFGNPVDPNSPDLRGSFQITQPKFCRPGDALNAVLCTKAYNGTTSGLGKADGGAVLVGQQKPWHKRLARIGLYIGSSTAKPGDTSRLNFYLIVAAYKQAMADARFGRYDDWNVL